MMVDVVISKGEFRKLMGKAYRFGFKEKPKFLLEMFIDEEFAKMVKA